MSHPSKRDLEREIADLVDEATAGDVCPDCGGFLEGSDAAEGVTAEFVTYECTCGDTGDGFDLTVSWEDGDAEADPDEDALLIDFSGVDT